MTDATNAEFDGKTVVEQSLTDWRCSSFCGVDAHVLSPTCSPGHTLGFLENALYLQRHKCSSSAKSAWPCALQCNQQQNCQGACLEVQGGCTAHIFATSFFSGLMSDAQ